MGPEIRLGIALVLVAINGLLVTTEFALVRARAASLEALRRRGSGRAAAAMRLVADLPATLAATQVGITLANLGIGWLGEPALSELFVHVLGRPLDQPWVRIASFATAFLLVTAVTVVLGELVPKGIGIQKAEEALLLAARPLRFLSLALWPIVAATNRAGRTVLRLLGLSTTFGEEAAHSEEELRVILGRSFERGQITRVGRDILERVFGFSRLTARQIMIPRPDVVWLSARQTTEENLEVARASGYTRFPYCDGDLDRIAGIVHVKDIIAAGPSVDLASVVRPPVIVPETATADRLLRMFQRNRLHLAIVVDEYGGTSGIVTLEDVLEEIVGDVQDEFDHEAPDIAPAGEGRFRIAGSARFEEVAERLGVDPGEAGGEVDTIAGFVQQELGRVARTGDSVALGMYTLRVEDTQGARIVRLLAERRAPRGTNAS